MFAKIPVFAKASPCTIFFKYDAPDNVQVCVSLSQKMPDEQSYLEKRRRPHRILVATQKRKS